ncbi:MAG TPA: hypothetical protein VIK73_03440 [Limnochordales bacterium]|nr:hypothetical protein [Bacillota bacterium]
MHVDHEVRLGLGDFSEALSEFVAMGARPEEARCRALLGQRRQAEEMFRSMMMVWDLEQGF